MCNAITLLRVVLNVLVLREAIVIYGVGVQWSVLLRLRDVLVRQVDALREVNVNVLLKIENATHLLVVDVVVM